MIYSILTQKQRERLEQDLELDLSYSLPGKARFRVNVYIQRDAIGAAFRMIPFEIKTGRGAPAPASGRGLRSAAAWSCSRHGPDRLRQVDDAGLAGGHHQHRADCHIMTVEDPIEFLHCHKSAMVNQREVGHDTHAFAEALARPSPGPRRDPGR